MTTTSTAGHRAPPRLHALVLALLATLAIGADEVSAQRKGFILGLGLGPAMTSYRPSSFGFDGERQNSVALGTDFKIGYAPNDQVLIYYSNDATFFGSERTNVAITVTGLMGIGATYFLAPATPSAYLHASIGLAAWNEISDDAEIERLGGTGVAVGAGFEFARHWNVDVDLILGNADDDVNEVSVRTLRFAVNWLLY